MKVLNYVGTSFTGFCRFFLQNMVRQQAEFNLMNSYIFKCLSYSDIWNCNIKAKGT